MEHLNFISQLVILKLILFRLSADLVIALLSKLLKFTLFAVLEIGAVAIPISPKLAASIRGVTLEKKTS